MMLQNLTIDAFASQPETTAQFKHCQEDRRLGKNRFTVMAGGLTAAIAHYAATPTPKVIIVEDDQLDQLERLAEVCDPTTRVIIVGSVNDIQLYRNLKDRGVAEYLLAPITAGQIVGTLDQLFADPSAAPKGQVVAFWGARGGVGSSSLAQNCAWLMGQLLQQSVLYLDCDLCFGSSQLALSLDAKQTLADVIANMERLDPVFVERSLLPYGDMLRVMASPADLRSNRPVSVEAVDRLIDIASRLGPVTLIDLPHLWSDWTEHLLTVSTDVVVTAGPDFTSLRNTKSLLDTIESPIKLVMNGIDSSKRTQLAVKDFESTLALKSLLTLPFDPAFFGEAANNGQIAAQAAPTHKCTKLLSGMVETLTGKGAPQKTSSSKLLDWLRA